jgi:hypothetical protein
MDALDETLGNAASTLRGRFVLVGGSGTPTWGWDGASWTVLSAGGPSLHEWPGTATLDDVIAMFGGWDGRALTADTWLFDGSTWSQFTGPGPSPRESPAMAGPY